MFFIGNPSPAAPTVCYGCLEADEAKCRNRDDAVVCATEKVSLGTTHCASAVGKYKDDRGKNGADVFFRGCVDCSSK